MVEEFEIKVKTAEELLSFKTGTAVTIRGKALKVDLLKLEKLLNALRMRAGYGLIDGRWLALRVILTDDGKIVIHAVRNIYPVSRIGEESRIFTLDELRARWEELKKDVEAILSELERIEKT